MRTYAIANARRNAQLYRLATRLGLLEAADRYAELAARWREVA